MTTESHLKNLDNQNHHKILRLAIGSLLILSFLLKICEFVLIYQKGIINFDSFQLTEFFINYQGGFVRRGLTGELFYHIYKAWGGFDTQLILCIISFVIFFVVISFYVIEFHRKRYCWWILFSPLLLNFSYYIIRKDFLLYGIFILIILCLRKPEPALRNRICATLLLIIALLSHEAIGFWGLPIYALLMWSFPRQRLINIILSIFAIATFLLVIIFKGNQEIAYAIADSWNAILPGAPIDRDCQVHSIGALAWETIPTFRWHWIVNKGENHCGQLLTPFLVLGGYYLFSNFLNVFNYGKHNQQILANNRTAISLLYSTAIIFLSPMLTFVSCDGARIFQYAGIATFTTFILIPSSKIIHIYPNWYVRLIENINHRLTRYFTPSKGWMLLLLLFLAASPVGFSLNLNLSESVIGSIWESLIYMRRTFV